MKNLSTPLAGAGIGLRAPHVRQVLAERPAVPWLEVHSENYYVDGGPALAALTRIRADYPLSLHGVGMSLGGADPLDRAHLAKLARLIERTEPALVSEHLCWSGIGGRHLNDLLPLPYTDEALAHVCARVAEVQDISAARSWSRTCRATSRSPTRRSPSGSSSPRSRAAPAASCCVDVNNIYVNAMNHGFDADAYLAALPRDAIAEIHLAGFDASGPCLIDTHGAPVAPDVWALYRRAIARFGPVPTLIEWDTDIPPLATLLAEAATAQSILETPDALAA